MDFGIRYTEEQERFREEVRAWLKENIPDGMRCPVDPQDLTEEQYRFWRSVHRKLGEQGWLYPTYPRGYGGGGLTPEHETILEEELTRARVVRPFSSVLVLPTLLVWGELDVPEAVPAPQRGAGPGSDGAARPAGRG